jgi:hypothetical protein
MRGKTSLTLARNIICFTQTKINIVTRRLHARMGELVEEAVYRQTHFHGNAQMEESGVSCWLNPMPYIESLTVACNSGEKRCFLFSSLRCYIWNPNRMRSSSNSKLQTRPLVREVATK